MSLLCMILRKFGLEILNFDPFDNSLLSTDKT